MMAVVPIPPVHPDEYLRIERQAEFRSEFVAGHVYAMSGASGAHSALIVAFAAELRTLLGQRNCLVTVADLRLQIGMQAAYVYPDVMVTCGGLRYVDGNQDLIVNPTLVVEVHSPSTERYDRTGKFALYRNVATLREYVLVSQNEKRVEWYTQNEQGNWEYREAVEDDGVCALTVLGVAVDLRALYCNIPGVDAPDGTGV